MVFKITGIRLAVCSCHRLGFRVQCSVECQAHTQTCSSSALAQWIMCGLLFKPWTLTCLAMRSLVAVLISGECTVAKPEASKASDLACTSCRFGMSHPLVATDCNQSINYISVLGTQPGSQQTTSTDQHILSTQMLHPTHFHHQSAQQSTRQLTT